MSMKQLIAALFAALSVTAAAPLSAQTTTTSLAGVGDSTARPSGAWVWPAGIELARPIMGYTVFMPEGCAPDEEEPGVNAKVEKPKGSGDLVRLCLVLRNTRDIPVPVVIPSGLMFVSDTTETQNGLVVTREEFVIEPRQILYMPLYMMCLNDGRGGSHPNAEYKLGPVLDNPAFNALLKRLEGKQLPQELAVELQTAVWAVAEGKAVPPEINAWIDALPDA